MTRQNAPKESLTAGDYLFSKTQYKFVFFLLQIYASWKINVQKKFLHNDISNFWNNAIILQTIHHQKLYTQIVATRNLVYSISRFQSLFSSHFLNKWARPPSQKSH